MTDTSAPPLSTNSLIATAREKTGLYDLGDDSLIAGLSNLVDTYNGEANLNEQGLKRQKRRLTGLLINRLRIEDAWKKNPALTQQPITAPLFVVSLPRTGTSALFNLLAHDPVNRPLLFWEGRHPDPIELQDGQADPRFLALRDALDNARKRNPEFTAIHLTRADGPEECVTLMELTFDGAQQGIEPLMEPYASWFQSHPLDGLYDDYRKLLSTLQYQRPGERWLLKSPAHLWGVDQILRLFPDACIVQTHRSAVKAVASYCSMIEALMANRRHIDKHELGARVLEYLATSMDRAMDARDAAGEARFHDVRYAEFVRDPVATVHGVYEAFDLSWTAELENSIRASAEKNRKGKHGSHDYSLAEYGLDEIQVVERFARYSERFL